MSAILPKIAVVNQNDQIIGYEDKFIVHKKGILHRAFSIIIFNKKNQMLLQKRSAQKYHSPGLWSNACCSHAVENEKFETTIHKRLKQEMGFDCELQFMFTFHYKVKFDNELIENEIDHVYFGKYDNSVIINLDEVSEYQWVDIDELKVNIELHPHNYTYWFVEICKNFFNLQPT